jgi:hypothetical protein
MEMFDLLSAIQKQPKSHMTTRAVGVVLTITIVVIAFRWPQSPEVTSIMIAGLIGVVITIGLELWVKLEELEKQVADGFSDVGSGAKIRANGIKDDFFNKKYDKLKSEINDLAFGKYEIPTLDEVYEDDIRTIRLLRRGEWLLSTCPITSTSKETALAQISEDRYKVTMEEHKSAAERGVKVTRIYAFRDRSIFDQSELQSHLSELSKSKMEIRILFRNKIPPHAKFDFLVFGKKKVSIGIIDPDTGKVRAAIVYVDRKNVEDYTGEYEKLKLVSPPLDELLSERK